MPRNKPIPVKSVHGHTLYHVDFWQALELLKMKNPDGTPYARDVTKWVHGKGRPQPVLKLTQPMREERESDASIGWRECMANARVDGSEGAMRRAQEKIEAWPTVGDERAVRVGPRVSA